ncbi:MAG: Tim44 domain-containing protein [Beijerinckiaceae bacterium]
MSRKFFAAAAALVLAVSLGISDADARAGGGGSFGSRGSRSYSMPSATPTAPRVSPFSPGPSTLNPGLQRPGFGGGGLFGGGFGRGFMGGLLGAGLFGLLFGHGLFGGLGGIFSFLGLLLQIGLVVLLVRFAIGFFRRRQQPAFAGGGYGGMAPDPGAAYRGASPLPGGAYTAAPATTPLAIDKTDYETFESRLADIQNAYGRGDVSALQRLTTPEMAQSLADEIAANTRRGVVNRVSDARLLQGDLSEAWREPGSDYATVAMRYTVLDATVEQASGRVVSGSTTVPEEVTEVWTFARPSGGSAQDWRLSAIQQAR